MNALLSRICALLGSARADHQLAAALVLGELAPREPAVVKAVSGALGGAARPLRIALLDALARIGSPLAVADLLPLLESTDDEVREKATLALAHIGPAAIKPIARQIVDAPAATRRALLSVLSRVRTADSARALVSLLASGHPDAAREAAQALVSMTQSMTRSEQSALRTTADKLLRTPADKAPAGSLSAGLMLMRAIGRPASAQGLLRLLAQKYPEPVRRDALLAISGVLRGGAMPQRILSGILPILQDGPSPALRSAALEVLGTVTLPSTGLEPLIKLLDSTDPAVRRFAARRLGDPGLAGARAIRRLVPLLGHSDPSLREAASESLGRMPDAAHVLVTELLDCEEIHRGWTIAHILRGSAGKLRRSAVRDVFRRAAEALTIDDRIWEPLLHVVRHHDPRLMYEWLMEEAARYKKARKYAQAEACLKPLTRGDHFDSEARYALALAGIRASRSRGGSAPAPVGTSLDLFRQLVRDPAFPLLDRLKKERTHLEIEDLYYLGFNLAEGTADEKEVGAELLKIVAARAGATKLGKAARNKLRSEGLGL
ncbi:MAG TPA: HEAT repeat domain-containing protein [Candidatus Polarisedimenticolia bacterium]|nr:HEAT repeat domain-containing protein [Candidatus Polarisedimenticolia bacterium]